MLRVASSHRSKWSRMNVRILDFPVLLGPTKRDTAAIGPIRCGLPKLRYPPIAKPSMSMCPRLAMLSLILTILADICRLVGRAPLADNLVSRPSASTLCPVSASAFASARIPKRVLRSIPLPRIAAKPGQAGENLCVCHRSAEGMAPNTAPSSQTRPRG